MSANTKCSAARKLVIGMGNEWRGDDGVGLLVARRLRAMALSGVAVRELGDDPTRFLEAWVEADSLYLVDALCSGSAPGTVRRWDVCKDPIATRIFRLSTHGTTVVDAVELARALKRLPRRLVIFGIEGKGFAMGCGVSLEAQRGADKVVETIKRELRDAEALEEMSTR